MKYRIFAEADVSKFPLGTTLENHHLKSPELNYVGRS